MAENTKELKLVPCGSDLEKALQVSRAFYDAHEVHTYTYADFVIDGDPAYNEDDFTRGYGVTSTHPNHMPPGAWLVAIDGVLTKTALRCQGEGKL